MKRKWFMFLCMALLSACGQGPLQKPVDQDVFVQQPDEAVAPAGEVSTANPDVGGGESEAPKQNGPGGSISEAPIMGELETPAEESSEDSESAAPEAPAYTHPPLISADSLDTSGLSNKKLSWYFMKNDEHQPTQGAAEMDISAYSGYYLGGTSQKHIWLTFDEGYENGYTAPILDTLKQKGVQAAFFCVGTYIRDEPGLVKRMASEGHVVANHSESHPSMPDASDEKALEEIYSPARRYKELTGLDMPAFFRPPSGEYSERVMYITEEAGYKSIFWSFAYQDWLVDQQKGKDYAYKIVMDNLHNGEILLLHAVSSSNAEALPDIIDDIKSQGYEFKSLFDLP